MNAPSDPEASSAPCPEEPSDRQAASLAPSLQLAAAGDSAAWRRVVDAYAPRVFGLLRAHCRDDELAEEIAQSTFCTLAAKIREYVESGRFESWLFRIAMNRLRDEMRRRSRHARSAEETTLDRIASRPRADGGLGSEERAMLESAMARLSEADRELVELRHTGGLSFRQLSDYFEEPIGTLLARHHRALKKLRTMLEQAGFEGDGGDAPRADASAGGSDGPMRPEGPR